MRCEVGADAELQVVTEGCFRDSRKNLTAASLKIWLFWDIKLCLSLNISRRSEGS